MVLYVVWYFTYTILMVGVGGYLGYRIGARSKAMWEAGVADVKKW